MVNMTEVTPLLRFVYATLAMRRRWERNGSTPIHAASSGSREEAVHTPVQAPLVQVQAPGATGPVFTSNDPVHLLSGTDDDIGAVGFLMPMLEVVLSAQMVVASGGDLDDAIVRLLGEICDAARNVGAFADLVKVLVTMLLDVDDAKDQALLHGVSDILLQLCFETRTTTSSGDVSITPTIYYDDVLQQIDATLSALFDVAATDALAAHAGVQCLAHTHAAIVSHIQCLRHDYYSGNAVV